MRTAFKIELTIVSVVLWGCVIALLPITVIVLYNPAKIQAVKAFYQGPPVLARVRYDI